MRTSCVVGLLLAALPLCGQWTLREVVERAGRTNPGLQASAENAAAAAAGVTLARTALYPKGDVIFQVNRATRNNVFGMLLPNRVIAPISGPPLAANTGTNVWGTATGFLISWEPFDLGQRTANIHSADAERVRSEKTVLRERFQVEVAAADAYLSVVAADELVKSAQATVERASALETVIKAQVDTGLKPGADLERARAEHAVADAQLIQAEQASRTTRAALVKIAGGEAADVVPVAGTLLAPPADVTSGAGDHPVLAEQRAAIDAATARRKQADIAWRPKFEFQSAAYARGTGARGDGSTGGGASGLGPNIYNWGVGFNVTFPFLDLPANRAQRRIEAHRAAAAEATLRQARQHLQAEVLAATAALDAAVRLSRTTPVQLESARAAHQQARARYQSGLTGVTEVAETQRLLAQAEVDDGLARLNVWRAQLGIAIANGDLTAFLEAAGR